MAFTTKVLSHNIAFIVDGDELKHVHNLLEREGGDPRYVARLSDESRVEFDNLDELLAFPNLASRAVSGLEIALVAEPLSVSIELGSDDQFTTVTVRYTVSGPDERVAEVSSSLDQWVREIKARYSWFAKGSFFSHFFAWTLILYGTVVVYTTVWSLYKYGWQFSTDEFRTRTTGLGSLVGTWGLPIAALIPAGASQLVRRWCFPLACFKLGTYGIRRANKLERNRQVGLVGVALAVLSAVVGTLL